MATMNKIEKYRLEDRVLDLTGEGKTTAIQKDSHLAIGDQKLFDTLMQTGYTKNITPAQEVRYEKTNPVTKRALDPVSVHARRNKILHKKGIRELPGSGPGSQAEKVPAKILEFPREYSKDPLTKYIYQKSFDAILEAFPGVNVSLVKILGNMGKTYTGVSKNRVVYLVPEAMARQLESFETPFTESQKAQDLVCLVVDKPIQVRCEDAPF